MQNRFWPVAIAAAALFPLQSAADDDVRALLRQLAGQVTQLQQQLAKSNARIEELEKKLQTSTNRENSASVAKAAQAATPDTTSVRPDPIPPAGAAKPVVTAGDTKDTFKIPGTETSLGIGGYVKMDALFNSASSGRDRLGDQMLIVSQIPLDGAKGEHSQLVLHPKESRVWLKSFTPSRWGDLNTYVEFDLFGDAATTSYTPRLRHAYGSIGPLLAGQAWTTFLNVQAIPDTLDLGGPAGALGPIRQPLIRWTQPLPTRAVPMELQVAAEMPRTRLWADPANAQAADVFGFSAPNAERYPDIVLRLNLMPDWGGISVAGMARQLRHTRSPDGQHQERWTGAVSVAGKISAAGADNLRFMLNYGDALGRYASLNTLEDGALDSSGRLVSVPVASAMLAYQHWWTKAWRTTLAYGYEHTDQPAFVDGSLTAEAQSVHANLLWSPMLQTTIGVEYLYAARRSVDRRDGDVHRVQFSTRFNF